MLILVLFVMIRVAEIILSLHYFLSCLRDVLSRYRRCLQYWPVLFLLLFLTHTVCLCHLSDVSLIHRHYSALVHFKNGPVILREGQFKCLSHWRNFCNIVWFRVVFLFYGDIVFNFFPSFLCSVLFIYLIFYQQLFLKLFKAKIWGENPYTFIWFQSFSDFFYDNPSSSYGSWY